MGAEYLSYVKSIATFAPTFYDYIISVLVSVFLLSKILYKQCVLKKLYFVDCLLGVK